MDIRIEEMMSACRLCPRDCGADRQNGQTGYCGQTAEIMAARAALHQWEEPCISGKDGSGTVFFSGCQLRCVYCQNREIALGKTGKGISAERLSEIFLELQEKGAHNINLVTPDHFVPQIAVALERARKDKLELPVVYNTGSYVTVKTLQLLEGLVDIYLPDLKYYDSGLGQRYSNAPDYFMQAKKAVAEMVRQAGNPAFAEKKGVTLMKKGVIVRHLVLPGCTEDSKKIVEYLYHTYGNKIYISLMNQYTPMEGMEEIPELCRKTTKREYDKVVDYAIGLGIENGFIQEGDTASESFIPSFNIFGI